MKYLCIVFTIIICLLHSKSHSQNVGIGTNMPDGSAILDVSSSSKGILIPRTDTTSVTTPASGLLIYQTSDNSFYFFNGTKWKSFSAIQSYLSDTDGDTKIYVEKNQDEDIIRFDLAGNEKMVLNKNIFGIARLDFKNNGNNTFIGDSCGLNTNLTSFHNTAIGKRAMLNNSSGDLNVAIGSECLQNTNAAAGTTAIGYQALRNTPYSGGETVIGYQACFNSGSSSGNSAIGYQAMYQGGGTNSTALGYKSMYSAISLADDNTAIGHNALYFNTENDGNTAIGSHALHKVIYGANTAVGAYALMNSTQAAHNVAVGNNSLFTNVNGQRNTAVGSITLNENIMGSDNVAIGHQSLKMNKSSANTAIGANSLQNTIFGAANVAIGTGSLGQTDAGENVGVGFGTLATNIYGTRNLAIGYSADVSVSNLSNATAIGALAVVSASNSLVLGNNANVGIGISAPTEKLHVVGNGLFSGTVTASCGILACSDSRYKVNIRPLTHSMEKIMQLQGVNYFFNNEKYPERNFNKKDQVGLIAQDVEEVVPELVFTDADGYKSIDYSKLTPVLIEAIKELKKEVDTLKTQISEILIKEYNSTAQLKIKSE